MWWESKCWYLGEGQDYRDPQLHWCSALLIKVKLTPTNIFLCSWRLEYFKKQYRQWLEPQSARKLQIAKKRLNLEISATEEMVLMSMCDQLHKVKACKHHACTY